MPFKDELAYGWFSRYHMTYRLTSDYTSWQQTSLDLFGKARVLPNFYYPIRLDYLCAHLPKEFKIDADYLINNNTIFPVYKPFMTTERASKIIQSILYDKSYSLHALLGLRTASNDTMLKICPICYDNDEVRYLHLAHQIPGNFICSKHNIPLETYNLDKAIFVDIDNINLEQRETNISDSIMHHLILVADYINRILNGDLEKYNIKKIQIIYKIAMREKGYLTGDYKIKQKNIMSDFINFYPQELLTLLNASIDEDYKGNWLRQITFLDAEYINPINHILFINFLFGSMESFLNCKYEYDNTNTPFGNGPWPCLNPVCTQYKRNVIQNIAVNSYNYRSERIHTGTFECNCGFAYMRTVSKYCSDDIYKFSKVKNYGRVWEQKLFDLFTNDVSKIQIGKILKCNEATIANHIKRLSTDGIIDTNKFGKVILNDKRINPNLLLQHQTTIINYISINPNASRSEIAKNNSKEYGYLSKHCKGWLENILPNALPFGSKQ